LRKRGTNRGGKFWRRRGRPKQKERSRNWGAKFLEDEKTAENRGGGPKKKNRDSERVGRKTETERETIVFFERERGGRKEGNHRLFLREKKSEEKGNQRQQKKKNRGEQRRKKEEKKKGREGTGAATEEESKRKQKKETTATFKPRIPAAATAPLSRCHRHLQPRIPAAAIALLSSRHRSATENSRQHHRQLSHPRSAPQVNSLSPLAAGPFHFISFLLFVLCVFLLSIYIF